MLFHNKVTLYKDLGLVGDWVLFYLDFMFIASTYHPNTEWNFFVEIQIFNEVIESTQLKGKVLWYQMIVSMNTKATK